MASLDPQIMLPLFHDPNNGSDVWANDHNCFSLRRMGQKLITALPWI